MATVYLSNELRTVAERLVKAAASESGRPMFGTYMEVAVFAAMVGYADGRKSELEAKLHGNEIPGDVFTNNRREGIVYLTALQDARSAEILREKNEHDCWRSFESYANAGLSIISDWLLAAPADIDGVDTLLTMIKERAAQQLGVADPAPIENVTF